MARMHSGAKGKSGSKKPGVKTAPSWMRFNAKEVEVLVAKLGKDKYSSSMIGMILRDKYGVPDVKLVTKKTIMQILKEKKQAPEIPEDLISLIKSNVSLRKHLETNKKDQVAKRGLILNDSKIRRLVKYYIQTEKLPADWKYDPERFKILVA